MINIRNLDFSYKKTKLFSHLSLDMKAGNIYGLLGKNGAGKTTLLKLISGLLFPNEGTIEAFGCNPRLREPEFLQDVFFLPEEYNLPGLKPHKYKEIYAPFYPRFDDSKYKELLEEFQLPLDQKLNSYSYGQKKKFLISFGIACNSRLFLLDEPTNGLDIPSKTQFRRIIASTGIEERLIIISTHQVRDMENLIDPLIVVDEGKVIFNQSMEEITDRLKVEKVSSEPTDGSMIYSEKQLDGYLVVRENRDNAQTNIELETLFNTAVTNPGGIKAVFTGGSKNENR